MRDSSSDTQGSRNHLEVVIAIAPPATGGHPVKPVVEGSSAWRWVHPVGKVQEATGVRAGKKTGRGIGTKEGAAEGGRRGRPHACGARRAGAVPSRRPLPPSHPGRGRAHLCALTPDKVRFDDRCIWGTEEDPAAPRPPWPIAERRGQGQVRTKGGSGGASQAQMQLAS